MTDFVLVHGSFQGGWIWQSTAAKLLAMFSEDTPWAHLDIAGTAWVGAGGKGTAGATGYGVALVLTWLLRRAGRL